MNRITAIMIAFLVVLLLATGFMAADNIRLSGERAAIAAELNQQHYDQAILTRQLENQQAALEALTLERDELLLQLQDYQPSPASTAHQPADDLPLVQSIRETASALPDAPSTPVPSPRPTNTAAPLPQADAVTEDIFALATPAPTSAPAFQSAAGSLSTGQISLLIADMARLRQRVDQLEARLDLILAVQDGQNALASPAPISFAPGQVLRTIRENFLVFFREKER